MRIKPAVQMSRRKRKGPGCFHIGCLSLLLIFAIFILMAICSDPDAPAPRNRDDDVLTDDEYENKPYQDLSEEEKKQALERIGKDVGVEEDDN